MRKGLPVALLIVAATFNGVAIAAPPEEKAAPGIVISGDDLHQADKAFKEMSKGHWKQALAIATNIADPLPAKILRWMDYTRPGTDASFEEIADFIEQNPTWPSQYSLRRRAEEAMPLTIPGNVILAWFSKHDPVSIDGEIRLIAALLDNDQKDEAIQRIRKSWVEGNFGNKQERSFYSHYRGFLTYQDHVERSERLMWEGRATPARRMLWRLNAADRALAEARIMLMRNRGNVDRAIARVPGNLRSHPGLIYERLRWRRRKGMDLAARELLDPPPENLVVPEKWWGERSLLARRALQDGHISEAYRLAAEHALSEGASYAEAEWLAGWIALRFLNEPDTAYRHFNAMYQSVSFPVSRSRGAYWLARAAGARGDEKLARDWFITAAQHPTTFYGQLAMNAASPNGDLSMPPSPAPTAEDKKAFTENELTRAIALLKQLDVSDPVRAFINALYDDRDTPGWHTLLAHLTQQIDRPDLGVVIAKKAIRDGNFMGSGYPSVDVPNETEGAMDKALVQAVIRQESAFQTDATSPVGARGLMQLMPGTARMTAKSMNIHYSRDKLTRDPGYNISIGTKYLGSLIEKYDGSFVLALAAYNAGPSRVNQWIGIHGDPRDRSVDAIDWIELIPFDETRNYVQRVLENLVVYRHGLGETKVATILADDLRKQAPQ
ncbi:MAG: lytic transglycosylase domain-containing protein [Rhodospirillales bacterium]|nr:lytic transglycosylase domain-containing protein [Rhodospirillales bacterium]